MRSSVPIISKSFIDLKSALPLNMPISIQIEPTNHCNYRCFFCPTGDKSLLKKVSRPKGYMTIKLYKKIIDDIYEMSKVSESKIKSILLYKDGEPLLHKDLPSMVTYAKNKSASQYIAITTNGSLLTKDMSHNLIDSGLDVLRISMQSLTSESLKKTTQTDFTIEETKSNIKNFFELKNKKKRKIKVIVSYVESTSIQQDVRKKFLENYGKISDQVYINPLHEWSRSDGDWNLRDFNKDEKTPIVCPDPFSKLSINFNGTVSLCCVDWSHGTLVGDLNNESFYDIWNGNKLKNFRMLHLKGKRSEIGPCKNCDYIKGKGEHDLIDSVKDKLINAYK
jgi:radical SAM protein with 4Fe4S-binding SPASM domain